MAIADQVEGHHSMRLNS